MGFFKLAGGSTVAAAIERQKIKAFNQEASNAVFTSDGG